MKKWLTEYKWLKSVTLCILAITILFGLTITLFELKPFWLDEWFIIYNLKFKTHAELWDELDFTQQFPRVYLQIIKSFTEQFHYSYTSLRLPSFLVHTTGIVVCYLLSRRFFDVRSPYRFLWVLIYASYFTSVHYFVQVKQYTMDMLLALVAIWQLTELIRIKDINKYRYLLLCIISFLIPYFSYTYPICFGPAIFIIVLSRKTMGRRFFAASIPILLGLASTAIFYITDVTQVMKDPGMQDYWKDYLMKDGFKLSVFIEKTYRLFANMGAGALFEILYGSLGIAGLLYGTVTFTKNSTPSLFSHAVKYSTILIWLVITLFILHKLPLGAHRLNAFVVPAAGILIVNILLAAAKTKLVSRVIPVFSSVLALAAGVGMLVSFADQLEGKEAILTRRIYQNVGAGISLARDRHIPIAVTPGIGYPFEGGEKDWVLKTHPEYDVYLGIAVYPVKDINALKTLQAIDSQLSTVVFIDKEQHSIVTQ